MTGLAVGLGLGTAGAAVFCWSTFWPRSSLWGRVVSRGEATGARYALTLDDGPTPGATDRVLDVLGELGVPAAFFVVGANVRKAPELLRRVYAEGHAVGNHTWSHDHLGMFRGWRYWERELRETDEEIERIIGVRPAMFRPPMGIKSAFIMAAAARRGQRVVTWSRRGVDGIPTSPERILDRLVPRTSAGDVLLLHDGIEPHGRRDPAATLAAIKPLILRLRDRGLEPAPLHELLGLSPYAAAGVAGPGAAPGARSGT